MPQETDWLLGRPDGSEADMFIQWKGTDVCMDFRCTACGEQGHFDGYFAYHVRCRCGAVYRLGTQVIARRIDPAALEGALPVDLFYDEED